MIGQHTITRARRRFGRSPRAAIPLLLLAGFVLMGSIASAAQAALARGDDAPVLDLKDAGGEARKLDATTTDTVLLLFLKPGDRDTSATIGALDAMLAKSPPVPGKLRRWAVLSRMDNPAQQTAPINRRLGPNWTLLLDAADKAYHEYKIIATPTVMVIGPDRKVAEVNPGYDPAMENRIRLALGKAGAIQLSRWATEAPPKPNMELQLARRLASRGLYDSALNYYRQSIAKTPATDDVKLEMAAIHIRVNQPDEALKLTGEIAAGSPLAPRAAQLRGEALKLKAGAAPAQSPQPPKVVR
ncbi:MAG: tetratricopeptide repeat protein [bacterium]|nr:tetratricopeptide repeat protein [bacterium]